MPLSVFVPNSNALRVEIIDYIFSRAFASMPSEYKKKRALVQRLQRKKRRDFVCRQAKMVGERIQKEPTGECEKWKNKTKVWNQLEKGGIAKFIECIHGFDPKVMNNFIKTWKDGRVKVNGVSFQVTEEVVVMVNDIPMEGIKFFHDKKLSMSTMNDFIKS